MTTPMTTTRPIRATWSATAATRRMRAGPARRASRVQFVLNYEEGGENCVLHGDAGSPSSSCPRSSAPPAFRRAT